jgi:hypothetical protein
MTYPPGPPVFWSNERRESFCLPDPDPAVQNYDFCGSGSATLGSDWQVESTVACGCVVCGTFAFPLPCIFFILYGKVARDTGN